MEQALLTARLVREQLRVPILAGGFGPTFHAEDFLKSGFDVVVRGEGEVTLLELVRHFTTGTPTLGAIQGISFMHGSEIIHNRSRSPITNLDTLPLPAHDTLALTFARKSLVHIQSSRGCQASCTFCSIVAFERLASSITWRQRSLVGFVDELEALFEHGVRHVKVIDDSLIEPPRDEEWCAGLADEMERRGLPLELRGSIRADRATPEVVAHLKRAGFFSFSCGIENFAPTALKRMAKRATLEQNLTALDSFFRHKIYVQAGHILFDHYTTIDELEANWQLMGDYEWTISKGVFSEMYAAAGTNFTRSMERRGLLVDGSTAKGTAGLGNATYFVADAQSRAAYRALKRWQRHHSRLYDMAIDPLSAPKAVSKQVREEFHELYLRLRRRDLAFFRAVLDLVSSSGFERQMDDLTNDWLSSSEAFHQSVAANVQRAYIRADLQYDADINPFIC